MALEWRPNDNTPARNPSPLEWASQVLHTHPSMPVILSTHEYIDDSPPGRSDAGNAVFNTFVKRHNQIFMVLCGHFHNAEAGGENAATRRDGEWHQVSTNDYGHPVIEVLQDFQDYPHGGDGWLRIITFNLTAGKLHFETYSPALDEYQRDSIKEDGPRASNFTISLDLSARLPERLMGSLRPFGHRHSTSLSMVPRVRSHLRAQVHLR